MSSKRKRVVLSLDQKLLILIRLEKGELASKLAQEFNIGVQTVRDLRKRKTQLNEYAELSERLGVVKRRKTLRKPLFEEVDNALYSWLLQEKKKTNVQINGSMIIEMAKSFHESLGLREKFNASTGWLTRFKERHGIGSGFTINHAKNRRRRVKREVDEGDADDAGDEAEDDSYSNQNNGKIPKKKAFNSTKEEENKEIEEEELEQEEEEIEEEDELVEEEEEEENEEEKYIVEEYVEEEKVKPKIEKVKQIKKPRKTESNKRKSKKDKRNNIKKELTSTKNCSLADYTFEETILTPMTDYLEPPTPAPQQFDVVTNNLNTNTNNMCEVSNYVINAYDISNKLTNVNTTDLVSHGLALSCLETLINYFEQQDKSIDDILGLQRHRLEIKKHLLHFNRDVKNQILKETDPL